MEYFTSGGKEITFKRFSLFLNLNTFQSLSTFCMTFLLHDRIQHVDSAISVLLIKTIISFGHNVS